MPTFGSLFAGIGGLDLGLERAGWECRWQVEIDEFCRQVLAKHWPDVPRYADVRECGEHNLKPVDLICGGFPCQPVSVAGKRLAQRDERWLWPEFARVVREVRPRYVLVENVPGLLAHGMGDVLRDLAAIGYDAEWESIPAAAAGAPHLRYRVFIVAHARSAELRDESGRGSGSRRQGQAKSRNDGTQRTVADSARPHGRQQRRQLRRTRQRTVDGREGCRRTQYKRTNKEKVTTSAATTLRSGWWAIEPNVGRVADGVPARVDRLRALGNAVVPQVAEWVGRRILDSHGFLVQG